jgi:hypothetical protein
MPCKMRCFSKAGWYADVDALPREVGWFEPEGVLEGVFLRGMVGDASAGSGY